MTTIRLTRKIPPDLSLDVDLHLAPGVTVLHGPAGAGKTLLLRLVAGLVAPDSGRILLDDAILYDAATRVHIPPGRRGCGYISQNDSLFPHMTLRQNVGFAARRFARLDRHRRIAEMLAHCGITDAAGLYPHDAGADARLRCNLARALVTEPRLLLVDDAGVDEALLRLIRTLFAGPILFVTGDLDLCCAAADELILLDRGRIVQRGVPRDVFRKPDCVEAARILGIPNLFQATIATLDPGRNQSRLEFTGYALSAPYIPGHFKGDRVNVAVRANELRVHPGNTAPTVNSVRAELVRASERAQCVRLEFSGPVFVDISQEEFRRQRDNKDWQVEFPPESLRIF